MSRKTKAVLIVLVLLFVAASGAAYYFYDQYQAALARIPKTPEEEIKEVVARVASHIILPNEQPTMATVTDLEALRGQPFFANAQIGNKVLIFPETGKAILYSPSADRIIEVGPFVASGFGEQAESGDAEAADSVESTSTTTSTGQVR